MPRTKLHRHPVGWGTLLVGFLAACTSATKDEPVDTDTGHTGEEIVPGCGTARSGVLVINNQLDVDVELREYWCSAGAGIYEPFGQSIRAGRRLEIELQSETWTLIVATEEGDCAQSNAIFLPEGGDVTWDVKELGGSYTDGSGVCRGG